VDPNGYLDVVAHGSSKVVRTGGQTLDAKALADVIRMDPQFTGQPIRLLVCNAGKGSNSLAEQLSTELGVAVQAPEKYLFTRADGTYYVAGGKRVGNKIVPVHSDPGDFVDFPMLVP